MPNSQLSIPSLFESNASSVLTGFNCRQTVQLLLTVQRGSLFIFTLPLSSFQKTGRNVRAGMALTEKQPTHPLQHYSGFSSSFPRLHSFSFLGDPSVTRRADTKPVGFSSFVSTAISPRVFFFFLFLLVPLPFVHAGPKEKNKEMK